jgi:hypothetical protein
MIGKIIEVLVFLTLASFFLPLLIFFPFMIGA